MISPARATVLAVVVASGAVVPAASAADPPSCGGIAANASVERVGVRGAPDGRSSTASQRVEFVPGGVHTLAVWTATTAPARAQATGLRFFDASGTRVLEHRLPVSHFDGDGGLERPELPPSTAPAGATSAGFFATTGFERLLRDCVDLRLAGYSVKKEVQNPATGGWGTFATVTAGDTAHYRITVTNDGSEPLTGITPRDPWCLAPVEPFALAPGANRQVTCDHPDVTMTDDKHVNTVKVTGVHHPAGTLGDKTASATIAVVLPPAVGRIGDLAWVDRNRDGVQDPDEPGAAGVKVTLKDGAGGTRASATTGTDGKYGFDKLKDGTYQVCFDVANLPPALAGHTVTSPDTANDDRDSDASPDGCTTQKTLGGAARESFSVDLGLAPPPAGPTS